MLGEVRKPRTVLVLVGVGESLFRIEFVGFHDDALIFELISDLFANKIFCGDFVGQTSWFTRGMYYVCIHSLIHIPTYVYIHMRVCVYICFCVCIYVCMCVGICVWVYMCVCV